MKCINIENCNHHLLTLFIVHQGNLHLDHKNVKIFVISSRAMIIIIIQENVLKSKQKQTDKYTQEASYNGK